MSRKLEKNLAEIVDFWFGPIGESYELERLL